MSSILFHRIQVHRETKEKVDPIPYLRSGGLSLTYVTLLLTKR